MSAVLFMDSMAGGREEVVTLNRRIWEAARSEPPVYLQGEALH